MKIAKNKKLSISTALILLIAFSAFAATNSFTSAHTPAWNIQPYCYVTATPNPVGVGQEVTVVFWINWVPPTAAGSAGDRWLFYLDITKPGETKQTVGPLTSDPVGGSYYTFAPDVTGNYTVTARFGPQVLTGSNGTGIVGSTSAYVNDTYLASSATATFAVQEEQIPNPPTYPLPTEYWTRPIEGQNNEWYTIASNWLGPQQAARFQPDGAAPNSAHVMWTKPLEDGGVVGGTNTGTNGTTFYDGTAYEGKFANPLIVNGRLYYGVPQSDTTSGVYGYFGIAGGYACVDLRTGKNIYWQNMTMPTFAQLYDYESMNQHGVISNGYLWTSDQNPYGFSSGPITWRAYDALTGNWLFNETNIPSGTDAYGPNGELLRYVLNATGNWLALWNNTAAQGLTGATNPNDFTSTMYNQWRPVGKNVDMSKSYSWNVTIPALPGASPTIVKVINDDLLLGTSTTFRSNSWGTPDPWTMWAISLKPETRGQLLWTKSYAAPAGNQTLTSGPVDSATRVFTMYSIDTMQFYGYDLDSGNYLWTSKPEDSWGFYSSGWSVAYGKLYHSGYGPVYCYDLKDGSTVWNFTVPSGLATPYTYYPLGITTVADGKVYLGAVEHSRNAPYWKNSNIYCLNATTGDQIWSLTSAGTSSASCASGALGQGATGYAVADGYYTYLNLYDMQIYTIGKGPSATTVTASPKVSTQGNDVLIEGTVIDTATGTTQEEQAARFPDGVPVVSDESMSAWMEYVYMQKPRPTDVTGVEVSLDVIDDNGNYRNIGQTTSDANGCFSFQWTPDIPSKYTVIATFAGSESYWQSHAETAFAVSEATPTQTPTAAPQSVADTYFIPAVAGLFVLVIVGFIVLTLLMLRKRP